MNIFDGYPVSCILRAHGSLFFNSTPMYYYPISSSHLSFLSLWLLDWNRPILYFFRFCSPNEFYVLLTVHQRVCFLSSISCMIYPYLFSFSSVLWCALLVAFYLTIWTMVLSLGIRMAWSSKSRILFLLQSWNYFRSVVKLVDITLGRWVEIGKQGLSFGMIIYLYIFSSLNVVIWVDVTNMTD